MLAQCYAWELHEGALPSSDEQEADCSLLCLRAVELRMRASPAEETTGTPVNPLPVMSKSREGVLSVATPLPSALCRV